MTATGSLVSGLRTVVHALVNGVFKLTHNGFALLGLAVACLIITLTARTDLREQGEMQLRSWLQARQGPEADVDAELDEPIERTLAADPRGLPKEQARVAFWLSKKYSVAPEPLSVLVGEAYELGTKTKLDPTLILAIVAIESRFNPFAQSAVGAQGLMQVMTRVHTEDFSPNQIGVPRRTGLDAGDDARAYRQVRSRGWTACSLRSGHQFARGRAGVAGMHSPRGFA